MIRTKKVNNELHSGGRLYYDLPIGITAYADMTEWEAVEHINEETGKFEVRYVEPVYQISYHDGWNPAQNVETYETVEELATAMKDLTGDLRIWKTLREDQI